MNKAVPILLVIGTALIAACIIIVVLQTSGGGPALTYQLSTSVGGEGSLSPSSGTFTNGELVTISAIAALGWSFDHWGGAVLGTQNPITITMNSSKTVTAYFIKLWYNLSTSFSPSGSGNVSPSHGTFDAGTQVTLTAIPASGWRFDHWGGDASGSSNTVTITMDSSKSVAAYFVVADDKAAQELRVPVQGHLHLANNEDIPVRLTIFSIPRVCDYLELFLTGWEADGDLPFKQYICQALGVMGTETITGEAWNPA